MAGYRCALEFLARLLTLVVDPGRTRAALRGVDAETRAFLLLYLELAPAETRLKRLMSTKAQPPEAIVREAKRLSRRP